MQKSKRTKSKKIKLFFVSDKDNLYLDIDKTAPNILCVTVTAEQANEYIDRRLFIEKFNHYNNWCELRDLKPDDANSWVRYRKNLSTSYFYEEHEIECNAIASLFRLFYGCTPIGCSFDTLLEASQVLSNLGKEETEEPEEKKVNNEA